MVGWCYGFVLFGFCLVFVLFCSGNITVYTARSSIVQARDMTYALPVARHLTVIFILILTFDAQKSTMFISEATCGSGRLYMKEERCDGGERARLCLAIVCVSCRNGAPTSVCCGDLAKQLGER